MGIPRQSARRQWMRTTRSAAALSESHQQCPRSCFRLGVESRGTEEFRIRSRRSRCGRRPRAGARWCCDCVSCVPGSALRAHLGRSAPQRRSEAVARQRHRLHTDAGSRNPASCTSPSASETQRRARRRRRQDRTGKVGRAAVVRFIVTNDPAVISQAAIAAAEPGCGPSGGRGAGGLEAACLAGPARRNEAKNRALERFAHNLYTWCGYLHRFWASEWMGAKKLW